jgi:hypothetical protein
MRWLEHYWINLDNAINHGTIHGGFQNSGDGQSESLAKPSTYDSECTSVWNTRHTKSRLARWARNPKHFRPDKRGCSCIIYFKVHFITLRTWLWDSKLKSSSSMALTIDYLVYLFASVLGVCSHFCVFVPIYQGLGHLLLTSRGFILCVRFCHCFPRTTDNPEPSSSTRN